MIRGYYAHTKDLSFFFSKNHDALAKIHRHTQLDTTCMVQAVKCMYKANLSQAIGSCVTSVPAPEVMQKGMMFWQ